MNIYLNRIGVTTFVVVLSVLVAFAIRRKCRQVLRIDIESESLTEFDAVVMRDFKNDGNIL